MGVWEYGTYNLNYVFSLTPYALRLIALCFALSTTERFSFTCHFTISEMSFTRTWFVEGESYCAFRCFVVRFQFFPECDNRTCRGVEAIVFFCC